VNIRSREIISPDVFAYQEPDENPRQPEALLEIFSLGETTISHDLSRISVFLDVSKLEMPMSLPIAIY